MNYVSVFEEACDSLISLRSGSVKQEFNEGTKLNYWSDVSLPEDEHIATAIADVSPDAMNGFEAMIGVYNGHFDTIFPSGVKMWLTTGKNIGSLTLGHLDSDPLDGSCLQRTTHVKMADPQTFTTSYYGAIDSGNVDAIKFISQDRTVALAAGYVAGIAGKATALQG